MMEEYLKLLRASAEAKFGGRVYGVSLQMREGHTSDGHVSYSQSPWMAHVDIRGQTMLYGYGKVPLEAINAVISDIKPSPDLEAVLGLGEYAP